MNEHTPTPWWIYDYDVRYPGIEGGDHSSIIVFGHSDEPCGVRGETKEHSLANAQFIVNAVNNHDALVAALDDALLFLMGKARRDPREREIVEQLRTALAAVREKG